MGDHVDALWLVGVQDLSITRMPPWKSSKNPLPPTLTALTLEQALPFPRDRADDFFRWACRSGVQLRCLQALPHLVIWIG